MLNITWTQLSRMRREIPFRKATLKIRTALLHTVQTDLRNSVCGSNSGPGIDHSDETLPP